jgi:hypothetical protein
MRRIGLFVATAGVALTLTFGSVASAAAQRVYIRVAPPAPIVEVRAASPGVGFVWVAGFHRWSANRYVWVPGHWERPPHPRAVWVPGRWHHARRGWYYGDGHWRR